MSGQKCECPTPTGSDILAAAISRYDVKWPQTGLPVYEYGWGGNGYGDKDNNGMFVKGVKSALDSHRMSW